MSLFEDQAPRPLADLLRPQSIDEVHGQDHILGKDQFVRMIVENKQPTSLVLWGPPGSGKTTLARIMAREWGLEFHELSAVTSGLADVRAVIKQAQALRQTGEGTLLFVDEIHRFNKAQQDAFLPHIEKGTIFLIGATTENPSFELNNALLSRTRVVILESLNKEALEKLIDRAAKTLKVTITKPARELAMQLSGGDGRVLLNALESATKLCSGKQQIKPEYIKQAMQQVNLSYDKAGEDHYNTVSAYIKSMRGSSTDAALYYLHRMLEAGEDPLFIARRLVIFASEDIGMAAPYALTLALSAFQAVERIGMPEGTYALTQATIALSESKKSRAVADALTKAQQAARDYPAAKIPLHLRNAPTNLMRELGYNQNYKWQADFKPDNGFLPDELKDISIYKPNSQM